MDEVIRIAEHLLAGAQRRPIQGLIRALTAAAATYFRGQSKAVLAPVSVSDFGARSAIDLIQSAGFDREFDKAVRAAFMLGVKGANSTLSTKLAPAVEVRDSTTLRSEIDATTKDCLSAAISSGKANDNSADDIRTAIRLMFREWAKDRALMIARYEISRAYHAGMLAVADVEAREALREAPRKLIHKVWLVQPEACPTCTENAEQGSIPTRTPFQSGDDAPPAHPHCLCSLAIVDVTLSQRAKRGWRTRRKSAKASRP